MRLHLPCGCFAWRLGSAAGAVPCGWHSRTHEEAGALRPCDCLIHRAERRGIGAYAFVEELADQESRRYATKPRVSDTETSDATSPTVEQDRKCECSWLLQRGEWRVETWCLEHQAKPEQWKSKRIKERNERGW